MGEKVLGTKGTFDMESFEKDDDSMNRVTMMLAQKTIGVWILWKEQNPSM